MDTMENITPAADILSVLDAVMTGEVIPAVEAAEEVIEEDPINVYEVRSPHRAEAFRAKVEKANNRLEKAGVDARFAFREEFFYAKERIGGTTLPDGTNFGGTEVLAEYVRFIQDSPLRLTVGDFTFVASLISEEAGMTVHTAPGQSLEGWTRPAADDVHCDHCNVDRYRTRIYVVRNNETGEIVQLGHNCIELYTGLSPKGLFALTFDLDLADFAKDDDEWTPARAAQETHAEVNVVLALAWAYSNEGKSYQNAKSADFGGRPTGRRVSSHIFNGVPQKPFSKDPRAIHEWKKEVEEFLAADAASKVFLADEDLLNSIKASALTLKQGSDYAENLRIILAGESGVVSRRNVAILASLVSIYAREKELAVQRKAAPQLALGFLDVVGKRLKGLKITLRTVRVIEGYYGDTTFMVGVTDDGYLVVWKASKFIAVEAGDVMVLDATVKEHDMYRGDYQTVLTRGKIYTINGEAVDA